MDGICFRSRLGAVAASPSDRGPGTACGDEVPALDGGAREAGVEKEAAAGQPSQPDGTTGPAKTPHPRLRCASPVKAPLQGPENRVASRPPAPHHQARCAEVDARLIDRARENLRRRRRCRRAAPATAPPDRCARKSQGLDETDGGLRRALIEVVGNGCVGAPMDLRTREDGLGLQCRAPRVARAEAVRGGLPAGWAAPPVAENHAPSSRRARTDCMSRRPSTIR